jgi:hypothetical protein
MVTVTITAIYLLRFRASASQRESLLLIKIGNSYSGQKDNSAVN